MSSVAPLRSCRLHDLVPAGTDVSQIANVDLRGIAIDSRQVVEGDLFLAVSGTQVDGHDYIQAAIANGAAAVFASRAVDQCEVPLVLVSDLSEQVSSVAGEFFAHPSSQMHCVAVTGTNGKTSVAHFVAQLAHRLGLRAGFLGTTGWGMADAPLATAQLTTADAVTLQRRLAELVEQNAELVALELSSHALAQHRGDGLDVDVALFTNLSRDHLDYHTDMKSYGAAKARLFEFVSLDGAAINTDDNFGRELIDALHKRDSNVSALSLGLDAQQAPMYEKSENRLVIRALSANKAGLTWKLETPWGEADLETSVIGRYNAVNLSLAVAALGLLGFPLQDIAQAVPLVGAPPGRVQGVVTPAGFNGAVYIDYAHTPDALATVLEACRAHTTGRLLCVFGCGGDRDRGKRAPMGAAVERCADVGILTSDNPRHEDPQQIINDVLEGIDDAAAVHVEPDRRQAIDYALAHAQADDLVLIAGKGHEDYQDVAGNKQPFDDAVVVAELLAAKFPADKAGRR